MSSLESSEEAGAGIAEELAASQRSISIAEFFEKNKHMLGFDSGARALVTAVKEACDNSLDATEEAGILPDIYVSVDEKQDLYKLVIEDNGPGITKEQIPKIFGKLLYGSRFHKREQSLTPDQEILVRKDGELATVPIGVLCDAYLPTSGDGVVPIPDDIEVPSFDRDSHEMTWQPVVHAIRHYPLEQTYEISTEKGRSVEVTGNHSLFTLNEAAETEEVKAEELTPGDYVLAPRNLPQFDDRIESINLLEYLPMAELEDRRIYVYGFDREELEVLKQGEKVRKYPDDDSERVRTFYRYEGVDILRDSLEYQYLERGFLPAETVRALGWEAKASDCSLRTYQVGGKESSIPVTVPLTEEFMRLVAYYICEGHGGERQIGLTFGSHEAELITAAENGLAAIGGESTTVVRERNSTRVKGFGSPIALFLKYTCGDSAGGKRMPSFVFKAPVDLQRVFVGALYQGDGSNAHPSNELEYITTSEELAQQLSTWWNMQGILASTTERVDNGGYSHSPTISYRVKVYSEDIKELGIFENQNEVGQQGYKRIPTNLLADVQVKDVSRKTVPDSIPGLLVGAGVGSTFESAEQYHAIIERAMAGESVDTPRFAHNLQQMNLLDEDGKATSHLERLWERVQNLHGLTKKDVCLLKVTDVTKTIPPDYVYDISVPGASGADENFVVANDGALCVKNSRGQQGIGISAAVLYSQLTSGKPAKITSRTQGSTDAEYFELVIDTDENEPEIREERTTTWDRPHGTRIEIELEANMRARQQLHDYIKQTAVVNPHARLELHEPDADMKFERATDELPKETEEIRPHPHGVELGTVLKMLSATDSHSVSGFLQSEFTRVGRKTTADILDGFRDQYYGREMTWEPPGPHQSASIAEAVTEATANKGKAPTKAFADGIEDSIQTHDRVAHHEIIDIVDEVATVVADEFDTRFGSTVRENAVEAAWGAVTTDLSGQLYRLVDDATSDRKDDRVIDGVATRIAEKFDDPERIDPKHRLKRSEVVDMVDRVADMTADMEDVAFGETARENIVESLWTRMRTVPDDVPKVRHMADDRDATSALVDGMRSASIMAPPTDCLAPITAELVEKGLRKEYDADFYAASTRDGQVHAGDPFIVEAGIAYGGELADESTVDVLRFANRVPLVYQRGACATTDVLRNIGWRNYGLDQPGGTGLPHGPGVLMVHVASTNVPFTSESKDAIANIPAIEDEIELAIRECARELKTYLNRRKSLEQRRQKADVLARILPQMATKVAAVSGRDPPDIDDALARIMNNVLIDRKATNGTVTVTVRNHSSRAETLELTEIVDSEPTVDDDGTDVLEMDGEWFLTREITVEPGDVTEFTYGMDDGAEVDFNVDGIDDELVTINA